MPLGMKFDLPIRFYNASTLSFDLKKVEMTARVLLNLDDDT